MTVNGTALAITADQRRVLVRFGSGENRLEIGERTGLTPDLITETLNMIAGNDRNNALQIVKDYDRHVELVAAARGPRASTTAVRPVSPAAPKPAATVKPSPSPVWEREPVDTVADLLDTAEHSGVAKLAKAAEKIRAQIKELQDQVGAHARQTELRRHVDQLAAELAQAQAELKQLGGTAAKTAGDVDNKAVRAWAKANGVTCNPHGKVPATVVDKWKAATS